MIFCPAQTFCSEIWTVTKDHNGSGKQLNNTKNDVIDNQQGELQGVSKKVYTSKLALCGYLTKLKGLNTEYVELTDPFQVIDTRDVKRAG